MTQRRFFRALGALALAGATAIAVPVESVAQHVREQPDRRRGAQTQRPWQGTAMNVAANATSGFTITLVTTDGTSWSATGQWDNQSLFGRFAVTGQRSECADRALCMTLTGTVQLGDDGSGFPRGTSTTFAIQLAIYDHRAVGVYHIGPLPSMGAAQYGTVDLHPSR